MTLSFSRSAFLYRRFTRLLATSLLPAIALALCEPSSASSQGVRLSISPSYAVVQLGQPFPFTATITGTGNTRITWQVDSAIGGNSSGGVITAAGVYTAPVKMPTIASATVTAVSQADPSISATAVITLVTQPAAGSTYYVSTSGKDSNPGTIARPWRHIQHAASTVQAGDTVYVRQGVYNEVVTMKSSGSSSSGFITFSSYPGELATVDGTGLAIPHGQWGLFSIQSLSYIVINGFEIRNYKTTKLDDVPLGIWIFGAGSNLQIVNNHIHNIETNAKTNPNQCGSNAFGMTVYGTVGDQSINALVISANEVDHNKTGCSETVSVDGNVENFVISNNLIHDDNNIGIDAIGFEKVSPNPETDQARDGEIRGNTVYNITSYGNPDYGRQYAADGLYIDGGKHIVVEQNLIHDVDLGIEMASEHHGHNTSYITARNNVIYLDTSVGISIGGYANSVGGTEHCAAVNNTLFQNGTKGAENDDGEFQIQFHANGNIFENNIAYANHEALFLNNFTKTPLDPAAIDYNLYYSQSGADNGNWTWEGKNYTGYDTYREKTGLDANSPPFSDPEFISTGDSPDFDIQPGSPAINAGTDLGKDIVGAVDFAGNPRVLNGQINIGAYEQW
ncbi:MAG TPA: choice-of-anchor Q domain-containing protein [Terriglobales bacterium]